MSGGGKANISGRSNPVKENKADATHCETLVVGRLYTMDRVVNVLPASVEKLTLKQLLEDEDRRNLFEHLVELKAEKLPALKTIIY